MDKILSNIYNNKTWKCYYRKEGKAYFKCDNERVVIDFGDVNIKNTIAAGQQVFFATESLSDKNKNFTHSFEFNNRGGLIEQINHLGLAQFQSDKCRKIKITSFHVSNKTL